MKVTVAPDVSTRQNGFAVNTDDRATVAAYRVELDHYYEEISQYQGLEPDQVMMSISGISARLTGIRAELQRSGSQRGNKLRTAEVDPLLTALDLQFRIASRIQAIREFDLRMAGGAPC